MTQGHAPCPFCRGVNAKPVSFTWWGGVLGPKMFSLHKCLQCGKQFNGKTGGDPSTGIIIYTVVGIVAGLIGGIVLFVMMRNL